MPTLEEDLRYANEGLAQMQEPDAGYFDDPANKQPEEVQKYNQDVKAQTDAIARLERKIADRDRKAVLAA